MNVVLLRYNMLLVCATVFLTLAIGVAYVYLSSASDAATRTITENTNKAQSYNETKAKADEFSAQLADAKTTMDAQISYSKALIGIAQAMPEGTALTGLELTEKSFGTPIELTFNVRNEATARTLLAQLEAAPTISAAKRGDITLLTDSEYEFSMKVTMTLTKELAQ